MKQNKISLIFGKKGSGKTELAKKLIPDLIKPILIMDSQEEYSGGVVFLTVEDFIDRYLRDGDKPPVNIFRLLSDKEVDALFQICWYIGNLTLVAEEMDLFCSAYQINKHLERLIKYGRHRNINLLGISRRPAEVNRLVTAQADELFIFRQTEPRDLEYFRTFGIDPTVLSGLGEYKNYHLTF